MRERGNRLLRTLDKYVGIPLIYTLGLLRKKKLFNPSICQKRDPRIVLLKTAGIGDTILVSAIIRELRSYFPEATITLICARSNAQVAGLLVELDRTVVFDMSRLFPSLKEIRKIQKCDLLFDFGPWPRINSLISFSVKARCKIGFKRKKAYRHYVYDLAVEHSDEIHELENYRNLLKGAGIVPKDFSPQLHEHQAPTEKINDLIANDKCNVVIHPFAGGVKKEFKEWLVENWVEVATELIDSGCRILISGGRDDVERAYDLRSKIKMRTHECRILAGNLSLGEMCAVLRKSELLISVNTGIMHLGAAVGTPVVALNGPSSPLRWGAVSENVINLTPKVNCAPCLSLGFEYGCKSGGCMQTITAAEVLSAAKVFLNNEKSIHPIPTSQLLNHSFTNLSPSLP